MAIFFAWMALAVIVGVAASKRGRVGFGWFLLTLVISPLIAGPLVLALPRRYAEAQTGTAAGGALLTITKGVGVAVLVGCLILIAAFVISMIAIVQHGGA